MSKGESTSAAAHQNRDDQLEESDEANKDTVVQNAIADIDAEVFERVLQRATVSTNLSDLLQKTSGEHDPALINNSIMGLIDATKEIMAAEKELNNIQNTKAPVKFDEVIDFIDDGAEEIIIEKKPTSSATFTVTSPIRGNPVVDLDHGMNGKLDVEEENYLMKMEQDPVSCMEMGNAPVGLCNNLMPVGHPVSMAVDDLDLEKLLKSQKNDECDENEQIAFLQERKLHEFSKINNVLGPMSQGQFATFANRNDVVGCDLGVYSPISSAGRSVFQTCTSNGRLLPAVPRKLFVPNDVVPSPRPRPNAYKALTTVMLNTANPRSCKNAEPCPPKTSPPPPPVNPLEVAKPQNNAAYNRNKKKKNRKYAKLAAAAALAAAAEGADELPDAAGNEDGEDKEESSSTITDYEGEEEEEKENEDGITEEEKEARRLKNRKAREKKRVKKDQELLHQKSQTPIESIPRKVGSNTANEETATGNTNGLGRKSAEEKKDKKEKNVQNTYTVAQYENEETLKKNLQDLGIESDDLSTQTGKKKKKESLKKLENKKKELQNNNKKQQKAAAVAVPQPEEEKTAPDSNKQSTDKMDEVAVAASITKRCSSGAGQQSEEDDDQSYVSAQENLGGSNSRLSTPPAEFVDARQSRDEVTDNVMADLNNYRKDEEVEGLAKQLEQEENEFVVVGSKNNKKKNKPLTITAESVSTSSNTSSASPTSRRNTHPDTKAPSTAASSVSNFNTTSNTSQPQRTSGRPAAHSATLGDFFMESTKKETHKNAKHKKTGPLSGSPLGQNKKQMSLDEPQPASPLFLDAVETPISVNTSPPTFSYADAAKKTSGENTPAHEMSPVPAPANTMSPAPSTIKKSPPPQSQNGPAKAGKSKSSSPPPLEATAPSQPSFASAVSGVQLPPSSAAAASADISFGYEETPEDKRKRQQKKSKTASPPPSAQQNSFNAQKFFDEVRSAESQETVLQLSDDRSKTGTADIREGWEKGWEKFMSGPKPILYKPQNKQ